ncbi:MAG TPA: LL-diaminopimelate aminotransferase [Candidatus Limadaptatus stercoripullorum]|uniref:LL-diaminopimelate aminotransferase n=1 Tax=Candidatus Limadaptatus stercoripullorum TaxID=2840846 RepID=A0A9D1SWM9_9FIRM|nr:LL-diaminopimelate aminotransferase [Candidatus Limadaptatus stercoripullorum]
MRLNQDYLKLGESYLFAGIAAKVRAFKAAHPNEEVISLGIGDVTRPLAPAVICALQAAAHEMAEEETFRGYGPEQGYDFLREAIAEHYSLKGVALGVDEIFVGDGAKSDLGNMVELFAKSRVLLPDPVYPAYRDVNVMAGNKLYFAAGGRRNGFKPAPPEKGEFDIIYICSPNNPTGAVYDREELKAWVDYARATGAVIFFDAAYEAFVSDPALPTSIFEIEGARECAVEFCSFSKSAGFTGMRCGWTVVPRELAGGELNKMWLRRQTTKFNGVSYVVQRAAAAALGKQGRYENKKSVDYYMQNARVIHEALTDAGIWHTGGVDSPYIWMRCPRGMSSWDYFDLLLERAAVVGTPGVGFGRRGEGYFRLTAFGNAQKTARAAERLAEVTLTLAR